MEKLSDYINKYKQYFSQKEAQNQNVNSVKDFDKLPKIKIAVLPSSTLRGVKEVLSVKCIEENILADVYVSDYNQYEREIIDEASGLYAFNPDLTILFIDTKTFFQDIYFSFYEKTYDEIKDIFESKLNRIQELLNILTQKIKSKVIIHNFEVPLFSPMGILENKQAFGLVEAIEDFNSQLRKLIKNNSSIYLFNYDAFCSLWGKNNILDYKMYYLGDIKLDVQYIGHLCEEYMSYIKPIMAHSRKCIVLDLDNTLWGGIVGEVGVEGVKLGPTSTGSPFWEFQKYIYSLYKRGIILAVNSKNNLEDAMEVINNHPYMILREKDFAWIEINWNNKIDNLKAIAENINIGLDSLIFIDDDKINREMVKEALPQVKVIELPEDPALYLSALQGCNDMNTLTFTNEDKHKGEFYAGERKRKELKSEVNDVSSYLEMLDLKVSIKIDDKFNIDRISQLTQKTNQFNTTTRRYQVDDIKNFMDNENYMVFSANVSDKYGDNGITAAAIVETNPDYWRVDLFLLSCRVIGREIEKTLLTYIENMAFESGGNLIAGEFIKSKKNNPAADLYKKCGYKLCNKEAEQKGPQGKQCEQEKVEIWEKNISEYSQYPEYIKLEIQESKK